MLSKLVIGVIAATMASPVFATDLPTLKLQIESQVLVDDTCYETCEFDLDQPRISPRIRTTDRRFAIPGFVRPLNEDAFGWYTIPANTSFEWYSANVLGNVYPVQHIGAMADVDWDGNTDNVFLTEINTPRGPVQLISVWIADPHTGSWLTHAEHLDRLYQGIEVDNGEIWLTTTRRGRLVYEQYTFPLGLDPLD